MPASKQKQKKLILALGGALLIFLITAAVVYLKSSSKNNNPSLKFSPQKVIAQVGKETLYGRDLNYEISVYFPQESNSQEPLSQEVRDKALEQVIEDSLLLQAAAEEKIINLNEQVFNSKNKNYRSRNILINGLEEKINQKLTNQIKGEMVSIWFKNIREPEIGLQRARKIARSKIENIYHRLQTKELKNLQQAAAVIKNDSSLASIDPSYKGNAYIEFEIKQGEKFFIDPQIQEKAFQLPPNKLSSILVGRDQNPGGGFYDCNFIVMRVLERKMRGFQSFEDWFKQKKQNYEVEIKI